MIIDHIVNMSVGLPKQKVVTNLDTLVRRTYVIEWKRNLKNIQRAVSGNFIFIVISPIFSYCIAW